MTASQICEMIRGKSADEALALITQCEAIEGSPLVGVQGIGEMCLAEFQIR